MTNKELITHLATAHRNSSSSIESHTPSLAEGQIFSFTRHHHVQRTTLMEVQKSKNFGKTKTAKLLLLVSRLEEEETWLAERLIFYTVLECFQLPKVLTVYA